MIRTCSGLSKFFMEGREDFEPSPDEVQEEVLQAQQYEGDLPDPFEEVLGG